MNIGQIDPVDAIRGLRPLKYPLRDAPHATIETNRTCNLNCKSCYTLDKKSVKPLARVKGEIDLALQKRNLQTITILGGEPTLYPDLEEVVAYAKRRGLFCQILSNGLVFLEDRGAELLGRLSRSRLDRILLHLDSGQGHLYKDLEGARRVLFSKCEAERLHFCLSLTIYNDDQGRLPELPKSLSEYRYFDGILAVLARDPHPPGFESADLAAEYRSLAKTLGLRPTAYVPSNLSDADVRWLFYLYFINADTKESFSCSPLLDRTFRKAFRLFRRRELFAMRWGPSITGLGFILAGLLETIHSPERIREVVRLWRNSHAGRHIRFQYIVIQTPPEVQPQTGQLIFCYHCPDATVRNGQLAPVCVADHINPLPGAGKVTMYGRAWAPGIFRHLGEDQDERRI